MDVLITIPDDCPEDAEELFNALKVICDNIDTNGIDCRKISLE